MCGAGGSLGPRVGLVPIIINVQVANFLFCTEIGHVIYIILFFVFGRFVVPGGTPTPRDSACAPSPLRLASYILMIYVCVVGVFSPHEADSTVVREGGGQSIGLRVSNEMD